MSKPPYIPFEKLKAAVSIQQVMDYTELPFKRVKGSEYRCECPIHKGGKRTLVVNTSVKDEQGFSGVFACHGDGGKGGDSIALLAHTRDTIKQYAAAVDLCRAYAPHLLPPELQKEEQETRSVEKQEATAPDTVPEETQTEETPRPEEKENTSEGGRAFQPLPYLKADHPAVTALGFPPEIANAAGLGFAPRGYHRNGVAVPIRTESGRLMGYISISEDGVKLPPKWTL